MGKPAPKTSAKKDFVAASPGDPLDTSALLRKLADNSRPVREKALKTVTMYLCTKKTLDPFKMQKLWRGLFFTMWHCDRPITQQNLANTLADLLQLPQPNNFWSFLEAFWVIMIREWNRIDKHRIDKFYLLIRRFVAATFLRLKNQDWDPEWLDKYVTLMKAWPLNPKEAKISHAIRLHMSDIYLDELEKLDEDEETLKSFPLLRLLEPFDTFVSESPFKHVTKLVKENVLQDKRLVQWGVLEPAKEEEPNSDSDWEGFA